MPFRAYNPAPFKPREFTRLGKVVNSVLAEQSIVNNYIGNGTDSNFGVSANGDRYYFYIICGATETKLDFALTKNNQSGKFDVYINDALDSSAYDMYAAVQGDTSSNVTLTVLPINGLNTVEFRVNGKNGASGGYTLNIYGVRLR
jgi:hypothetical protein